ncbi:hypothetical protein [Oceanisphaera avium]|uniref:Stress protein n=1 Tax=Oceanisphaera avium TaxID=1903694 RepID=A0A1Y0CVD9_9GAMM|nr:hypothetical protein [Oceanisphaera avium]ART79303.1 hypothetical protein CBP12_03370 [Oceanisphaera avium]
MNKLGFTRLQQSLQGGFTLTPKAIFQEAWARIYGAKMALILAALGVAGCWLVLSQLSVRLVPEPDTASWQLSVFNLIITMALAPMTAALDMLGIFRAVDKPVRANQIFNYYGYLLPLALASLLMGFISAGLMSLLPLLGLPPVLSLVPMLLLSVALMFTYPLILEKGLTPLDAIATSLKLFARQWLQLLAIQLVFLALFIMAILSLGLLLIWVAPLYMVTKGIIYREVCGVEGQVATSSASALNNSKDNFQA